MLAYILLKSDIMEFISDFLIGVFIIVLMQMVKKRFLLGESLSEKKEKVGIQI